MDLTDTKIQILAEHYKNTFDFLQTNLRQRNKLFIYVLSVLILLLFQLYTPQEASLVISQFVLSKLSISTSMNLLFLQSIIWFILLAITLKYFQSVVFIERQYEYLHKLENQLSKEYEQNAFTREGDSYLKDYPAFLGWASLLYTVFFPAVLVIVTLVKIISEFKAFGCCQWLIWFNLLAYLLLTISIILYIKVLHFKKTND